MSVRAANSQARTNSAVELIFKVAVYFATASCSSWSAHNPSQAFSTTACIDDNSLVVFDFRHTHDNKSIALRRNLPRPPVTSLTMF